MTNCYKTLGVKDFASPEEIKTAYRKLSKKFHPDVNDGDKFFEERFKEIQNAYEILSDSRRKEIHDSKLKNTYSSSNEFNFQENKTENNQEPGKDKSRTDSSKDTQRNQKTKSSETKASTNQTFSKPKSKPLSVNPIAILILFAVVIGIIVIINRKQNDSSSNNISEYYSSQGDASDNYSNHSVQSQTDESPTTNFDDETQRNNEGPSQTYSSNDNYFTVGSNKDQVLQAQGDPTGIHKYEAMGKEIWNYGLSSVTFENGRVSEFSNLEKNLNAKMKTSEHSQRSFGYFTVGSGKDEVLQAQGDPTGIHKYEGIGKEIWNYGLSSVTFENERVSEFSNLEKNLNAKMKTSEHSQRSFGYFTVGSGKDEVLQAQGDPTGIHKYEAIGKEIWNYGLSSVTFENERVSEFSNLEKNLKVRL